MNMGEPLNFAPGLLRGRLFADEPMGRHVSWRAGGRAARCYAPADADDLAVFLRTLPAGEPLCFVGLGSNLLVRDGGYAGTVIQMHSPHATLRMEQPEGMDVECIYAAAGAASPKVARFAATHDYEGAEFLAGVPGSVGGALAMNAGCYGSETWAYVERVRTIDRRGTVRERTRGDYDIGYRHCALKSGSDEWFLGAWFRFRAGDGTKARARIRELLAQRIATQPAQRRLGVPQSRRRPCSTPRGGLRAEGLCDRRCAHFREARELHRQSGRQGKGRGHRGADHACAAGSERPLRHRTGA